MDSLQSDCKLVDDKQEGFRLGRDVWIKSLLTNERRCKGEAAENLGRFYQLRKYDSINREMLWHILSMNDDIGDKLLRIIKSE